MAVDYLRDYGQDAEVIKQFFLDFTYVTDDGEVVPKYGGVLTKLANREGVELVVDLGDLEKFNEEISRQVANNTIRYTRIFEDVVDELLPTFKTKEATTKDTMDIFIEHRLNNAARNQKAPGSNAQPSFNSQPTPAATSTGRYVDIDGQYPPDLIRRVEITFKPAHHIVTPIRDVRAAHIGKMVTIKGIVTRVSEVKPQITVVTYTCDQCGNETFQPVKGYDFVPLNECSSMACKANKTHGRLTMQIRGSKFVKSQEIKLQEHSDQVPAGHIPRAISVNAHGELTRNCAPGNHVSITGVYLPVERTMYRRRTGGLAEDTFIEAHHIMQMNKTEDDELNVDPMTTDEAINLIRGGDNFLGRLSRSIAPEIYGHENLKKALLLLLVGGVTRSPHGMRIRGNINICLMGDPGVAKSQLLSFIDRLAPRSQYTTGRGSSGVGLTAAVLKDPITNELSLEGGALVLADEGICCIDEFDKMMEADRTAIHEVMEQQTVSIAKAGIMTTLNARVSILAAANPAFGRYNIHRSVEDNLELPPALLSRFDLLWLIRDQPEAGKDLELAQHITNVHTNPSEQFRLDDDVIDMRLMRRYINLCKTKSPTIPESLTDTLENIYLDIRKRKRASNSKESLFTSPRSLLAIIRLATAFARLRLADVVEKDDIKAAVDLYNCSRESIEGDIAHANSRGDELGSLLRELCTRNDGKIPYSAFLQEAREREFIPDTVEKIVGDLEKSNVIELEDDFIIYINH